MSVFAIALIAGSAPALAQNRFMDEAKDAAARRAENDAIRKAEHPEADAKPAAANTATASAATAAPAETAPAAQTAPATPAEPAAPAQPAQ